MLNKVILIGRLGADPELRILASGQKVASFRLATNEVYKDKEGNWQDKTEWHSIIAYGGLAESVSANLTKGRMVCVVGSLRTRSWEDRNGNRRYTTEIVAQTVKFLNSDKGQNSEESMGGEESGAPEPPPDSDLPF